MVSFLSFIATPSFRSGRSLYKGTWDLRGRRASPELDHDHRQQRRDCNDLRFLEAPEPDAFDTEGTQQKTADGVEYRGREEQSPVRPENLPKPPHRRKDEKIT